MGFVLIRLILLRVDLIYTRRVGLRAANLNDPMGIVSVSFFCRRLFCFCLLAAVGSAARPRVSLSVSSLVLVDFPVSVAKR